MTNHITHWINGASWSGTAKRKGEVFNPATGLKTGEVDFAELSTIDEAIESAAKAFPMWRDTSLTKRAQIVFKFRELLNNKKEELAAIITSEHGKVLSDALGEVTRGQEVVEFACGIPHLLKGGFSEGVSNGVDVYSIRQPVGVVAGITPFNFPAMVPMWFFPIAIAAGNTFILKPSEKDPSAAIWLAKLWKEAGLPDGVFTVINGDKVAVDRLLEHPKVKAISFVGSTPIAKYVYETGTKNGKRVQALGGAKNHMVVLPDADLELTADAVTKQHRDKVASYVEAGIKEGATAVVDGRNVQADGAKDGYWLGPTLFDNVKTNMTIYTDEIFGPVLSVVRVKTYEEALKIVNDHPYGNGTAIFTNDGGAARRFQNEIEVGMVGVNVPIPVPVAYYSFGGWKNSLFGDSHAHGTEGVNFYTRGKVITSRWLDPSHGGINLGFPQN
jgi:malonate-semialdehyde dehydrogenase (acetylating)/methylmalonate-semialdehyde dehydrogenase